MVGMLGKTVLYHLTRDDQAKAGGRHTISTNTHENIAIAAAIVSYDHKPEENKPHTLGLRVICDSRDTLWIPNAAHGNANGEWEFVEAERNQFMENANIRGKKRLNQIITLMPTFGIDEFKELRKLAPSVNNTEDLGRLTPPEFETLLEKLKEQNGQILNIAP